MRFFALCWIIVMSLFPVQEAITQGCSDAGVCTINSMVPAPVSDSVEHHKNNVSIGLGFGMSQWDVLSFTPYLEYSRQLGDHFSVSGKVNYGFRSGELASLHGLSDAFLSMGYTFYRDFTLTGGVKFPLSHGNRKSGTSALPMNYQLSLGTVDLLLGFGYKYKRFSIMAGYQQPLTQNNNQFLANVYPSGTPESKYFSTRNYYRAADAILRVSYYPVKSRYLTLLTSILPIFHVNNDSFQDTDGTRITLKGSQGLTLNLNAVMRYHINKSHTIELNAGAPVLANSFFEVLGKEI